MNMQFSDLTIKTFLQELGSATPAPGGGSAAALAGAMAASLCSMVARITLGSEKYKDAWEDMKGIQELVTNATSKLSSLATRDNEAYGKVMEAYRLPKQTEEQQNTRQNAIQEALKGAALVPLETLRAVHQLLGPAQKLIEKGNPNCITDVGVAVLLIESAAKGAAYNVRINLSSITDAAFSRETSDEVQALMKSLQHKVKTLNQKVEMGIG